MESNKENILNYLKSIQSKYKKEGIITFALFGSFAKNSQGIYSDIDIAIKKDKEYLKTQSPYKYFEILNSLRSDLHNKFNRNIDIIDLDSTSPFLDTIKKDIIYV